MSAFIVPDRHINVLIAWASHNRVAYWNGQARAEVQGNELHCAAELYRANVKSVNTRYSENESEEGFVFKWPSGYEHSPNPLVILKACDCYDYQACEVDDYRESEAWRIVDAIRGYAIRRLPGYDSAEGWALGDGQEGAPESAPESANVH